MLRLHAHCSYCGSLYADEQPWPRYCSHCKNITYRNPLPVAVVLQPIDDGILLVRRGIQPGQGKLALPGGYLDYNEPWENAGAREVLEETGLHIDPLGLQIFDVKSTAGNALLIFATAAPLTAADLPPFVPNDETLEIVVTREPIELAFPLHQQALARWFARYRS